MECFLANWRELCLAIIALGAAVAIFLLFIVLAYASYRMAKTIK